MTELPILWLALIFYLVAGCVAILGQVLGRPREAVVLGLLVGGIALVTLTIGVRWVRIGYGPFATMFEILISNLWSLSLIYALAYWRVPPLRPSATVVMPFFFMLMGWMLVVDPGRGQLPPTYDTIWLYIHIGLGKVFLGAVLVALGLSGVILLRRHHVVAQAFRRMPNDASLDELAFRFMAIGLIFDTLMLVTGAIWAQDAWGRYWSWDPLETWAFLTWLLLALAIHTRLTLRPPPVAGALMVMGVFVMAFLTFFGIPFVTQVPHMGAV
jgi:ABC-type transport system involved in cytochrome c biogenesis permease subunit